MLQWSSSAIIVIVTALVLLSVTHTSTASNNHNDYDSEKLNRNDDSHQRRKLSVINLSNSDFTQGTYRITTPGKYVLSENISFCPNTLVNFPADVITCCRPTAAQFVSNGGVYPDFPYAMGFFAAITIETQDVEIDLNRFTLEQCKEHALMQRFFAAIELANAPFIFGEGPRDFGSHFVSGTNILIHNGYIGRSSHHGIHGNGNVNVTIQNVDFKDYEIAAVALNGVKDLNVIRCTAVNRKDVPVLGTFSAAIFISYYMHELRHSSTTLTVQGVTKTASQIKSELLQSINNVYEDVIYKDLGFVDIDSHPEDYALFHNRHKVIDGNSYGFLTNPMGVAVNKFPTKSSRDPSENVYFRDVQVIKHHAAITEIVALWNSTINKAVVDVAGAAFQLRNGRSDNITEPLTISTFQNDTEAEYIGNVVANAQAFTAKAILNGELTGTLPVDRNMIYHDILNWIEAGGNTTDPNRRLSNLLLKLAPSPEESGYHCNVDSMIHVNKGVISFKIDGTRNVVMEKCIVYDAKNLSGPGATVCKDYDTPDHYYWGYGGANVRGFSFAGNKNARIRDCHVTKLTSYAGTVIAYDVHTDSSDVDLANCHEDGLTALGGSKDSSLADDNAYGLRFWKHTKYNRADDFCFADPRAVHGSTARVRDDGFLNYLSEKTCDWFYMLLDVDDGSQRVYVVSSNEGEN